MKSAILASAPAPQLDDMAQTRRSEAIKPALGV
jgi:hypothetical protein